MRRLILGVLFLAAAIVLTVGYAAQSTPNSFYDEHATGVQQNPPGVTLKIATLDGRSTYRLSETIGFKLALSSTKTRAYTYETGANMASVSDDLVVLAPGQSTAIHSSSRILSGTVCCWYVARYLSEKPSVVIFRVRLASMERRLRPLLPDPGSVDLKPGGYKVFVQTRRVFRDGPRLQADHHGYGPLVTSSNVLSLTILSDKGQPGKR